MRWPAPANLQLGMSSEQWPHYDNSRPAECHRQRNPRRSFAVRVGLRLRSAVQLASAGTIRKLVKVEVLIETTSTAPPLYPQLPFSPGGQRHMQTRIHPGMCIQDLCKVRGGCGGSNGLAFRIGSSYTANRLTPQSRRVPWGTKKCRMLCGTQICPLRARPLLRAVVTTKEC